MTAYSKGKVVSEIQLSYSRLETPDIILNDLNHCFWVYVYFITNSETWNLYINETRTVFPFHTTIDSSQYTFLRNCSIHLDISQSPCRFLHTLWQTTIDDHVRFSIENFFHSNYVICCDIIFRTSRSTILFRLSSPVLPNVMKLMCLIYRMSGSS